MIIKNEFVWFQNMSIFPSALTFQDEKRIQRDALRSEARASELKEMTRRKTEKKNNFYRERDFRIRDFERTVRENNIERKERKRFELAKQREYVEDIAAILRSVRSIKKS